MICGRCAHAADLQLPASEHCDEQAGPGAWCDCQHKVPDTPPPRRDLIMAGAVAVNRLVQDQPPPAADPAGESPSRLIPDQ